MSILHQSATIENSASISTGSEQFTGCPSISIYFVYIMLNKASQCSFWPPIKVLIKSNSSLFILTSVSTNKLIMSSCMLSNSTSSPNFILLYIILDNTDKWSAIKYTVINNSSILDFSHSHFIDDSIARLLHKRIFSALSLFSLTRLLQSVKVIFNLDNADSLYFCSCELLPMLKSFATKVE